MFVSIAAHGRDARLVIHGQGPVLEVDDLMLRLGAISSDTGNPLRDLWADPVGPRAATDDQNLFCVYHARNMAWSGRGFQVQNTRNLKVLGGALVDLMGFLNSPQRDDALLREAGVNLDRALFPLLVATETRETPTVAELADLVGRDHSTVSRQLAKLESLGLLKRRPDEGDRRRTMAGLTDAGRQIVRAIAGARRRLLASALAGWSDQDLEALAGLNRRVADTLIAVVRRSA